MNEPIQSWEIWYYLFLCRLCAFVILYVLAYKEWGVNIAGTIVMATFLIARTK